MPLEKITYWHNPRCSKSRQGLALLQESGAQLDVVEYLKTPPDRGRLKEVARFLGLEPRAMMRRGEPVYKELALKEADDETLFAAMAENPILIERPIAIKGTAARIGRPPETLTELLKA